MHRVIAIASSVVLLGFAAHGVGAQGKSGHGAAMATVAASTCVTTNPHNAKVKNHGQCVAAAARGHSGKGHGGSKDRGGSKDHGKHLGQSKGKGHAKANHPGAAQGHPEATEVPEPTEAPEATDTP